MQSNQVRRLVETLMRRKGSRKWAIGLVVAIVAYSFLQPMVESRFDISLPSLTGDNATNSPASSRNEGHSEVAAIDRSPELKQIGDQVYQTPAGLVYGRGSQQGHRIKHVMMHANDEPGRPGQHGVFDASTQADVLAVVDEAYLKAKRGDHLSVEKDRGRTIYEVDVGRRIGFVGGQTGKRRNHPVARHVRLVLEGNRVITAFPFVP